MVKVLQPGFYSSIQDLGRIGFQGYGVPYSGVMDKKATTLANALLGNNEQDAVLEMTMTGAMLQFKIPTYIVITGANMLPKLNNIPIQLNKIISVNNDDILSFGKLMEGFRCYLAVFGGFKTEIVMGSKSMYEGITKQVKIHKNDELIINSYSKDKKLMNASVRVDTSYMSINSVEVFEGPEFNQLSEIQKKQLLSSEFTISKENNRMAYQLEESIKNSLTPIITSLVLPGSVQLTPSGKLIILMRDCQTTGGYPRVLQLKEASIDILAQKFTGNKISFKLIPMQSQSYL